MCRLFGFRSVIQSQVHRSLLDADNALGSLSDDHPDGWGVAYYVDGAPHITRSPTRALNCQLFQRVSGIVASETVLAHVRKATVGDLSVLNCHPFQYGKWTFAHNGEITDFRERRETLVQGIAPRLRRFVLGDTDSEVLFYLLLSELSHYGELSSRFSAEDVARALRQTIDRVREICDREDKASLLTVILTDGTTMVAIEGGKELYWSTYKTRCADRETCPSLSAECEAPTQSGYVNHLIFASEPPKGENIWLKMQSDAIIGVDWRMHLMSEDRAKRHLSLV